MSVCQDVVKAEPCQDFLNGTILAGTFSIYKTMWLWQSRKKKSH